MKDNSESQKLLQELRRLAVEDPLQARARFLELLDSGSSSMDDVLRMLGNPGDGRLRQLIANVARTLPVKDRLVPFLIQWKENETDEFASRAIDSALANCDLSGYTRAPLSNSLAHPHIVQGYRYASGRISHKLRNALLDPEAHFIRLRKAVNGASDPNLRAEMSSILGELSDGLQRIGTIIEFSRFDPKHFSMSPIALENWLRAMNQRYGSTFTPIKLTIEANGSTPRVYASDYFLETIFWNIWMNAQQAVGKNCAIVVQIKQVGGAIEITVFDNGEGFSQNLRDIAFRDAYSSNGLDRGSGLLEVQEAVERLHGEARLIEYSRGEYRVRITLPVAQI